jgi:hypothetical protein
MSDTPTTDDDFSDLVEECNSPAAKRIEQLERELAEAQELLCQTSAEREHNGRMANECRMQRDRLAEALERIVRRIEFYSATPEDQRPLIEQWEYTDGSSDMKTAREALAAVKG